MTDEQLTRLFECLLMRVTAFDLHKMLDYAIKGTHPMCSREQTATTAFTATVAKQLAAEVERLRKPASGPPKFPPRG